MKIVIPGGTGFLGEALVDHWLNKNHEVVVLTRSGRSKARTVRWDGRSDGDWMREIDGADVVVNLAGRNVNCRYTPENLKEMMDSRVLSTRAVGRAITQAKNPPSTWLQMSTATIYSHSFEKPNDEVTGEIGGSEPGVPAYWRVGIDIAQEWEKAQSDAPTLRTRKVVLRTSMVMGRKPGTVFAVLKKMSLLGVGGAIGGGRQYMSWIHEGDFARVMDFLLEHSEISGAVNICAPEPLPQREFMRTMRKSLHVPIGLPAAKWMVEIGAVFMRTDTELLFKSRRVVPRRLLETGFQFQFPHWTDACGDLLR